MKNKRHWIPIFIGMTRENLEKQKKRHTVLDTVSSDFTGEARSVLKNQRHWILRCTSCPQKD
ncbi:MAG: hypothetical protein KBS54_03665 [Synergistaceae bacterium]|nr:hypothetical protein [Candidatus Equadaptatus faecalis]